MDKIKIIIIAMNVQINEVAILIHPVFKVTEWLESQIGEKLTIEKEELLPGNETPVDLDHVQMTLKDVSVRNIERRDIEGYLADQEIILHGEGKIITDKGLMDLPQSVYEIPILGDMEAIERGNQLTVETEKAVYTFYH